MNSNTSLFCDRLHCTGFAKQASRHACLSASMILLTGLVPFDLAAQSYPRPAGHAALLVYANDTRDDCDDFVAVSKGVDPSLATNLNIVNRVEKTLTATITLKNSDGSIKFEKTVVECPKDKVVSVKMWGIKESSDRDKTIVLVEFSSEGKAKGAIEELVTVFSGVKAMFEGNYYSNVDTRDFARRPWDGRKDPKPNSKRDLTGEDHGDAKEIVDQDLSFGYESNLSFKKGDNISNYKPWAKPLEVKVAQVFSKVPICEMTCDGLKGQILEINSGTFSAELLGGENPLTILNYDKKNPTKKILMDGFEYLLNPSIIVGDYFTANNPTKQTMIKLVKLDSSIITSAEFTADIAGLKAKYPSYKNLLDFYGRKDLVGAFGVKYNWENSTLQIVRRANATASPAGRGISAKEESKTSMKFYWIFTNWNELYFQGDLSDAYFETL
jgi:hypothetical protein